MADAKIRKPLYKDVLQTALHRRFSSAVLLSFAVAYVYAVLLGSWNSFFWSWFPIGPVGFRIALLLPIALFIVTLRIAQYHVGVRTSNSGFQSFLAHAIGVQTAEAIVTYSVCALLFSWIYRWTLPEGSGLELVNYYMSDRAKLNEKSIYFTANLVLLGVYQGIWHLFEDTDRLVLGTAKADKSDSGAHDADAQWQRLWAKLPSIVRSSFNHSLTAMAGSLFVYGLFLRTPLWRLALFFLRPWYNLPRSNFLPATWPFTATAILRSFYASFLFMLFITLANVSFSMLLSKEPLKNKKPLSSDAKKDPNGSLLNGLKSKKESIKGFAMWELAIIARDYPDRRKGIYEDIDRAGGPMWSEVYAICLDAIKSIETRIDGYGKPPPPDPAKTPSAVEPKKRYSEPPKEGDIFTSTPPKSKYRAEVEKLATKAVIAPGQGSQLSPIAKKALETGKQSLLKVQKEVTGSENPQTLFRGIANKILTSYYFGRPFRQEYSRRLAKVVLGTPYGEPSLYINAASALGSLTSYSLVEDKYGNVQRDVATIIRTLTTVTAKLTNFKDGLELHWTDVEGKRTSPDVEAVLGVLKATLSRLIEDFGPYARDLRLSLTDIRLAKEAAGMTTTSV
ncbi:hypothetical protein OQA88_11199 [Cercophora sp. LCS_1]